MVFRSAKAMRVARGVTHVVFDKIGTLTQGCLSIVSDEYCSGTQNLSATVVAALTSQSDHPVLLAVFKNLKAASVDLATVGQVTHIMGKGTAGNMTGQVVRIGNARWLGVESQPAVQSLLSQSLTISCATQEDHLVAVFGLEATLRDDASNVVAGLVERGIAVPILSGDEIGAVRKVAQTLEIAHEAFRASCTPREKQQYVKELVLDGNNTSLFCGSGVSSDPPCRDSSC